MDIYSMDIDHPGGIWPRGKNLYFMDQFGFGVCDKESILNWVTTLEY